MLAAPLLANEQERLEAVYSLNILDTKQEHRFDRITKHATKRLHVPISTISILDKDREWFKSCQGLPNREGERSISFCGHALGMRDIMVVEDTLRDDRFKDNPNVIGGPKIRFYAGMALHHRKSKLPIGVFCIKDTKPRQLSVDQLGIFMNLANAAEEELNSNPTENLQNTGYPLNNSFPKAEPIPEG